MNNVWVHLWAFVNSVALLFAHAQRPLLIDIRAMPIVLLFRCIYEFGEFSFARILNGVQYTQKQESA